MISGFLIGSQIYKEVRQGTFSYRRFYYRRAKRILPALIAVVSFTAALMVCIGSPTELRNFGRDAVAAIFSFSNVTLYRSLDYFRPAAEANPLLMTWSLGVEEQFYIAAPFVLALTVRLRESRRLPAVAALALLSLVLATWQMRHNTQAAFYLLPPRVWELGAGVMLAMWQAHRGGPVGLTDRRTGLRTEILALAGLALLIIPIVSYGRSTPFPGLSALPSVIGTVLLLTTRRSFVNRRVLSNSFATFFGLISYSLYLWHWPLISVTHMTLEAEPSLLARLALMGLSIVLAYASYRWVETPFRKAAAPEAVSLRRYVAVMTLAAVVTGSAYITQGLPQRWPETFSTQEAAAGAPQSQCLASYGVSEPLVSARCVPDGRAASVALIGDSHAAAMGPAIQMMARSTGIGFQETTKSSCPFLHQVSRDMLKYPRHVDECQLFNERVMQGLIANPRIKVVVVGGFWRVGLTGDGPYVSTRSSGRGAPETPADLLYRGLSGAVTRLTAAGKQVVLLGDAPFFQFMPLKRAASCANAVRGHVNSVTADTRDCEFGSLALVVDDSEAEQIVRRVATESGADYFDPKQSLCDTQGCRFSAAHELLYIDQQHLSVAGARLVAKPLMPFLSALMADGTSEAAAIR